MVIGSPKLHNKLHSRKRSRRILNSSEKKEGIRSEMLKLLKVYSSFIFISKN
jgi:hypothetical protein